MKRIFVTFLMLLILFSARTVSGQPSEPSNNHKPDTICPLVVEVRDLVYNRDLLVAQRTLLFERINKLQEDNLNLTLAINANMQQIAELQKSDSINKRRYQSLLDDAQIWINIRDNKENEINGLRKKLLDDTAIYEKALKQQKRKTKAAALGGIGLAIGLGYLYLIK